MYVRHGHARHQGTGRSPTWQSWRKMRARCDNPRELKYANYGGRGISYDPRWSFFEAFLEDMGQRPEGRSLDRIDSDGNYTRENCRWATPAEQAFNSRKANRLQWAGRWWTTSGLERHLGMSRGLLVRRLQRGWVLSDAVVPVR